MTEGSVRSGSLFIHHTRDDYSIFYVSLKDELLTPYTAVDHVFISPLIVSINWLSSTAKYWVSRSDMRVR